MGAKMPLLPVVAPPPWRIAIYVHHALWCKGPIQPTKAALSTNKNSCLCIAHGFHDALNNFQWLQDGLKTCPTSIFELVPMAAPTIMGTHNVLGTGDPHLIPLQVLDATG
jgi:hypothetical protein